MTAESQGLKAHEEGSTNPCRLECCGYSRREWMGEGRQVKIIRWSDVKMKQKSIMTAEKDELFKTGEREAVTVIQ